jgi:hypothetical protein
VCFQLGYRAEVIVHGQRPLQAGRQDEKALLVTPTTDLCRQQPIPVTRREVLGCMAASLFSLCVIHFPPWPFLTSTFSHVALSHFQRVYHVSLSDV